MDEQTAARHRTIVGRLTLALGASGILRLIPELLGVLFWLNASINRRYEGVLILDAVLGGAMLAGGWALRRGSSWGWTGTTAAWAAVASNSAVVSLVIIPQELRKSAISTETLLIFPRIAFYAAAFLAVPYVLWASFAAPRSGGPSRIFIASLAGITVAAFWWTTASVLEVDPLDLHPSWAR